VLAIACAGRGARVVATDAPWVIELLRLNAGWLFSFSFSFPSFSFSVVE
jgi:hypothetical protein